MRQAESPGDQPLQATVALFRDGSDIAHARRLAAEFLTRGRSEHGVTVSQRGTDLTRLVVSELVTNARKYASGPVLMNLRIDGGVVEVTVWDSEPELPVVGTADAGRVGQHGLEIVMAVAQKFEAQRGPLGKRVTARIALSDDPGAPLGGPGG